MRKFNLIKVRPESLDSSYVRSHCLVVSIYDHATMRVDSIEEDGFKWYDWGSSIGLVAPCEAQPEWQSINCAEFIAYRMEAIKQIGEMEKPRVVPEWSDEETQVEMHWPWDHECKRVQDSS